MKHPVILEAYTRAQAIEQGLLVDVSDIAAGAGFSIPVALTWAAWAASIEWAPNMQARNNDAPELVERVRAVLEQCAGMTRQSTDQPDDAQARIAAEGLSFQVQCGTDHHPISLTLKAAFPLERADELGVTIMLPDEF